MITMPRVVRLLAVILAVILASTVALAADAEPAEVDIAYYPLKPSIVSNVSGGPKYLRCDIQLMTETASEIPNIALHSPALRHTILMLIAAQDGKQLLTRDGKEQLRQAALESVRSQLEQLTGNPIVKDLYFTAYYVK